MRSRLFTWGAVLLPEALPHSGTTQESWRQSKANTFSHLTNSSQPVSFGQLSCRWKLWINSHGATNLQLKCCWQTTACRTQLQSCSSHLYTILLGSNGNYLGYVTVQEKFATSYKKPLTSACRMDEIWYKTPWKLQFHEIASPGVIIQKGRK